MKKVFLSFFAISLCFGAFAQDSTANEHQIIPQSRTNLTMKNDEAMAVKTNESIMMKNGKVTVIENGRSTELTQNKTLTNGTIISVDGSVKATNGTTTVLKDGDWVNQDGTISRGNQ